VTESLTTIAPDGTAREHPIAFAITLEQLLQADPATTARRDELNVELARIETGDRSLCGGAPHRVLAGPAAARPAAGEGAREKGSPRLRIHWRGVAVETFRGPNLM